MDTDSALQFTAPIWMPDSSASSCLVCATQFNAVLRKHHCRLCGFIICNACSRNSFFIPFKNGEKQARVCDACLPTLIQDRTFRIHVPSSLEIFTLPARHNDDTARSPRDYSTLFSARRAKTFSILDIVGFFRLIFGQSSQKSCTLCLDEFSLFSIKVIWLIEAMLIL